MRRKLMVYDGHVEKGVVVADDRVTLPEGARVKVEILPLAAEDASGESLPTLYETSISSRSQFAQTISQIDPF
jgi:uncharacterized lipoprotein YbaY